MNEPPQQLPNALQMASAEKLCNSNVIDMTDRRRATNLENNLINRETIKRTLESLVNDSKDEKVDVSPEIGNKSPNTGENDDNVNEKVVGGGGAMNKSFSMYTFGSAACEPDNNSSEESPSKTIDPSRATAFVIDFGGGKQPSGQRHKHMLERFQNRHRRGVSLSKVEDEMNDSSSSSQLTAKLKSSSPASSAKASRKLSTSSSQEAAAQPTKPASAGVRLRERSKTSQVRDASKRHSWSPRTSLVESTTVQQQQQHTNSPAKPAKAAKKHPTNPLERPLKLHALTRADVKPLPPTTLNITTLQCLQTPLISSRESHNLPHNNDDEDDQVSEAGTYTLDGDNYTEEQKAKMNIDNLAAADAALLRTKLEINESDSNVETDLEVIELEPPAPRTRQSHVSSKQQQTARKNILEVSFYHHEQPPATASSKSKSSYLDKLKTKVKSSLHKAKSPESDVGTFTSVTTSGVLSVKPSLEVNPKLKRKNSLTKSQIDSSEYIQGRARTREPKGPVTDSDKSSIASAYQLNIFPAAAAAAKQSPAKSRKESSVGSSSTSISTAATKDDWIQEWARNAREYSKHKRPPPTMSSSFNAESRADSRDDQFGYFVVDDVMSKSDCKPHYDEFGDNLERYHQKSHHKKSNEANNLNSNSSSVSSARGRKILRELEPHRDELRQHSLPSSNFNIKPPISPCRIPSPIGSVSHRKKRYGSSAMLYGSDTVSWKFSFAVRSRCRSFYNLHTKKCLVFFSTKFNGLLSEYVEHK